jgi:predicted branched-subunit amino acid permease
LAFLPVAAAIGVFGVLYGAAARPILGAPLAIASSFIVFSGTVQFTMVGLMGAGSSPLAVLWAIFVVNLRNLALGAALRPHLKSPTPTRVGLSWFLIDETVGLALIDPRRAEGTLLRSGVLAYATWTIGTVVGVAGGAALGLEGLAAAIFPVLFVGLASVMVGSRDGVVRSALAVAGTVALLDMFPALGGIAPVLAALLAAAPAWRSA